MSAYAEKQRDKAQEAAQAMQEARTPPIVTKHRYQVVPDDDGDWQAYFEGYENLRDRHGMREMYGLGCTEAEAVKDLLDNWEPPT